MIISGIYWKILSDANHELLARFEKLQKARARGDAQGIKNAEMDYFQALQRLYAAVQDAVAKQAH